MRWQPRLIARALPPLLRPDDWITGCNASVCARRHAADSAASRMPTPTPTPPPASQPLSIVVADDEADIRTILVRVLEQAGHQVTAAATGLEAMQRVSASTDLVVADILMPNGDGLDLIRHARHLNRRIRILAISGGGPYQPGALATEVALQNGADAALLKPFSIDDFVAAVQRLLTNGATAPNLQSHLSSLPSETGALPEEPGAAVRQL